MQTYHDNVRMTFANAVSFAVPTIDKTGRTAEHELLIDLAQLVFPEAVQIENVTGQEFCGDAAAEVLNALANPAPDKGSEVAVDFGIRLFYEGHPCFVLGLVPAEKQGLGPGLVGFPVPRLSVLVIAVDLVQQVALQTGLGGVSVGRLHFRIKTPRHLPSPSWAR